MKRKLLVILVIVALCFSSCVTISKFADKEVTTYIPNSCDILLYLDVAETKSVIKKIIKNINDENLNKSILVLDYIDCLSFGMDSSTNKMYLAIIGTPPRNTLKSILVNQMAFNQISENIFESQKSRTKVVFQNKYTITATINDMKLDLFQDKYENKLASISTTNDLGFIGRNISLKESGINLGLDNFIFKAKKEKQDYNLVFFLENIKGAKPYFIKAMLKNFISKSVKVENSEAFDNIQFKVVDNNIIVDNFYVNEKTILKLFDSIKKMVPKE